MCLGDAACFNAVQLCQIHQFLVCCRVEPRLRLEAINDMWALQDTCREAFECAKAAPSATQQQVSETLRHIGLSVEDEVRCPKSGYSIDMLVHDKPWGALVIGGERSSSARTWAVEYDGPKHFLASGAPTGATLLKRRHLELMGHALVIVGHWEWNGCRGFDERVQLLRGKLADSVPRVSVRAAAIESSDFYTEESEGGNELQDWAAGAPDAPGDAAKQELLVLQQS